MSIKPKKMITYKGEKAKVSTMAHKYGVPIRTILARIQRGWSDVECIEGKKGHKSTKEPTRVMSYGGMTGTLKEWSKKTGISVHTLISRHRRGWSVKQILEGKRLCVAMNR